MSPKVVFKAHPAVSYSLATISDLRKSGPPPYLLAWASHRGEENRGGSFWYELSESDEKKFFLKNQTYFFRRNKISAN
jgi:hypothetical protein